MNLRSFFAQVIKNTGKQLVTFWNNELGSSPTIFLHERWASSLPDHFMHSKIAWKVLSVEKFSVKKNAEKMLCGEFSDWNISSSEISCGAILRVENFTKRNFLRWNFRKLNSMQENINSYTSSKTNFGPFVHSIERLTYMYCDL